MPVFTLPVRPDVSLLEILLYAVLAFAIALVLTPWFVRFLRMNKIGKQLRVETIDGRDPAIFRTYHQNKFGTPTMGGVLIWGSIVATIIVSRLMALSGLEQSSLLQRGQVYLPLTMLLSFGVLGAMDDYLNIIGSSQDQWNRLLPIARKFFSVISVILVVVAVVALMGWSSLHTLLAVHQPLSAPVQFGVSILGVVTYVLGLLYLGSAIVVIDDYFKGHAPMQVNKKGGLGVRSKITFLTLISIGGALWFSFKLGYNGIHIPYLGDVPVGLWYIPIFMFIIVGTANAVNFTDGLDGLASGLLVIAFAAFGVLAYLQGLYVLAGFCAVCVGAIAAFLWHNVPPALFFMGDTGSLALGGTLGVIALMIDQAAVLPLIGFVFVIEMLSVIIQLSSKKLRGGKKVFRAAPLHHHFEALEWGESKVTMRLWIVGAFFAVVGVLIAITG